ncbi:hypothetical protein [Sphingobium nicotianae]|uniref:Uncharacterized protein n=1 Tax=Sphingobium nicotianae TaxID=2782607 RepID=A0A9X1ISP6_9SPHN|nr:hypothetical protein [Sphingobium nicotianae]MBT2188504.1 hypothetical protein [Sphingobium nicotianae]
MGFPQTKEAGFKTLSPTKELYGLLAGLLSFLALVTPVGATAKQGIESPTISGFVVAPAPLDYRLFPTRLAIPVGSRAPAILPRDAVIPSVEAEQELGDKVVQFFAIGPDLHFLINRRVDDARDERIALGLRYAQAF